ncbi:LPXTG cell wall anchor domain-containing protein, partial [Aerococcus sp. L_4]
EPNNTDAANVTVEPKNQDLPPAGVESTTITSILGALFLSIGSALVFKKKRK